MWMASKGCLLEVKIRSAMGPLWISHVDGKHRLSFGSVRCHVEHAADMLVVENVNSMCSKCRVSATMEFWGPSSASLAGIAAWLQDDLPMK